MDSITFDHVPTGSVGDALAAIRDIVANGPGAIVRSVDSAASEHDLKRSLQFHGIDHEVRFGNVCVTMVALWKALAENVFTGFDEVWLFRNALPTRNLGTFPSATSDGVEFSTGNPPGLADAMVATDCILILGDGCGLNYATADDRIVQRIRSVSE